MSKQGYTSKGAWFVKGSLCMLIDDYRPQINSGLFRGQRRCADPAAELHALGEVYEDEEVCGFGEFEISEAPG